MLFLFPLIRPQFESNGAENFQQEETIYREATRKRSQISFLDVIDGSCFPRMIWWIECSGVCISLSVNAFFCSSSED